MLTIFPGLLTFNFFAPTLLRIAAALTLFFLTYNQYKRRKEIAQLERPVIGKSSQWSWASIIGNTLLGILLFVGYYTQIAALIAIVGQVVGLWYNHRFPKVVILSNVAVLLLIIVLFSLMLTGAGALAFDLPL